MGREIDKRSINLSPARGFFYGQNMTPEIKLKTAEKPFYVHGRVFLASRFEALEHLLEIVPPEKLEHILFIPTAANNYPDERKAFLEGYRQWFRTHNIPFTEIDLAAMQQEELLVALRGAGAIVVAGGNTQYLLEQMQRTDFARTIKPCIERGVWYIGVSAGAVVAGPNIEHIVPIEPAQTDNLLTDYTALALVPSPVVPHADQPFMQGVLERLRQQGHACIAIPDPPRI